MVIGVNGPSVHNVERNASIIGYASLNEPDKNSFRIQGIDADRLIIGTLRPPPVGVLPGGGGGDAPARAAVGRLEQSIVAAVALPYARVNYRVVRQRGLREGD